MPKGIPNKKDKKKEEVVDISSNVSVDEAVEKLRKENEELKQKLENKETEEAKITDPMSGPGILCEAPKITHAEAWQLPMRERLSPISQTPEMISDPVPDGMAVKKGPNNSQYVVYPNTTELIPNCKSKFTKEYWIYTKKPAEDRGNFKKEPPKQNVHLCEKHAHIFQAHDAKEKTPA